MLALSMAVIAALIGAGGLGLTVYTGLGRLDVGRAFLGGLGIVLLAIILDRITQGLGQPPKQLEERSFRALFSRFRKSVAAPAQNSPRAAE
jgi:glycine betaine/proline transport system permease protein